MSKAGNIVLAAKCAPERNIFNDIKEAGLNAIELYISSKMLENVAGIVKICKEFPFRYCLHAPTDGNKIEKLAKFATEIKAELIVMHNIYWEDEWMDIINIFKGSGVKLCVENTYSCHEPLKFMRRFGVERCLDFEHLQIETCGVFEEIFIKLIRQASHIHLTGYVFGSQLWHTHIHHSRQHNLRLLGLIRQAGYSGFIVSEAKQSLQNLEEFKKLNKFCKDWEKSKDERS